MTHAVRERRQQEAEAAFREIMPKETIDRNSKTVKLRAARLQRDKEEKESRLHEAPEAPKPKRTKTINTFAR